MAEGTVKRIGRTCSSPYQFSLFYTLRGFLVRFRNAIGQFTEQTTLYTSNPTSTKKDISIFFPFWTEFLQTLKKKIFPFCLPLCKRSAKRFQKTQAREAEQEGHL